MHCSQTVVLNFSEGAEVQERFGSQHFAKLWTSFKNHQASSKLGERQKAKVALQRFASSDFRRSRLWKRLITRDCMQVTVTKTCQAMSQIPTSWAMTKSMFSTLPMGYLSLMYMLMSKEMWLIVNRYSMVVWIRILDYILKRGYLLTQAVEPSMTQSRKIFLTTHMGQLERDRHWSTLKVTRWSCASPALRTFTPRNFSTGANPSNRRIWWNPCSIAIKLKMASGRNQVNLARYRVGLQRVHHLSALHALQQTQTWACMVSDSLCMFVRTRFLHKNNYPMQWAVTRRSKNHMSHTPYAA